METNSTLNTAVAAEAQSTGIKPKAIGIIGIVGILAVFPALHFAMGGTHALIQGMVDLIQGQGNTMRLGAEV
ncbi:MAG: phytoene desaturase, partial [Chloroflexota bacterium]